MNPELLLPLSECSLRLGVEITFFRDLEERGLIKTTMVEEVLSIEAIQLPQLERLVRLYQDLEINFEGLEAIVHLLERLESAQNDLTELRNRLRLYE
ncbi:MAG: chaperone modulator CbpM [Bacteroidota bacterium]|nr:chaperone modulator CbpM [Bacteroidota bacterium]MDP4230129.1 chaperone modulator CbpM [Bacteroidota bacterium]MDP4237280.1 chaperone modulator CbpM [Bacteroidota bacterium]